PGDGADRHPTRAPRDSLGRDVRVHPLLERVPVLVDLHERSAIEDDSRRCHPGPDQGRRVLLGRADGRGPPRLGAGRDALLLLRRLFRRWDDRGRGQGLTLTGIKGRREEVRIPNQMASVSFENVTKRFAGDTLAVNNLNLEIKDTEFIVVVGPSGCGKSTALRMLAGLEDITEGQIKIGKRVVNDMPPRDRDIALVFQSYALYPHMTASDHTA